MFNQTRSFFAYPALAAVFFIVMILIPLPAGAAAQSADTAVKAVSGSEAPSGVTAANETAVPPKAVLQESQYDFGMVKPEQTVSHDFLITNEGEGTLEIEKVTPG